MNTQIEAAFTYHAPTPEKQEYYITLRNQAKELAYTMDKICPNSREKSLAFTKLEEVIMWANAAIARNPFNRAD